MSHDRGLTLEVHLLRLASLDYDRMQRIDDSRADSVQSLSTRLMSLFTEQHISSRARDHDLEIKSQTARYRVTML
jgi:hypothetical protein